MADLIVVGGGVSGLFAAITAATRGKEVIILEKNDTLGKKILITGNGRCNFTNDTVNADCYESSSTDKDSFVSTVLNQYNKDDLIKTLKALGMSYYVREGYYYPKTDEAVTFRDTLLNEIERLGVKVVTDFNLRSVDKTDDGYVLSNKTDNYTAPNILIATGGKAAPKTGSSGDSYYYLEKLGHTIIGTHPALTTLKAEYPKSLQGVNALCDLSLFINGKCVDKEKGFIKYYKGMLSGIPIYQLSLKAIPALEANDKVEIVADFLSDSNAEYAFSREGLSEYKALCQSVNPKIVDAYYVEGKSQLFYNVNYEIIGNGDYSNAQCTLGGVRIDEINPKTMESKICKGLFVAGEIVDICGRCGGYNIQWAASTGTVVGNSI
ncbi:MAG: aminoacetone oxidase family FAD-binding enzyme [Lachnospiraceae bacterium]|nr:aminoacetone oxidase family FAD-binding enzyme [Lachnospiraceae bacterium]